MNDIRDMLPLQVLGEKTLRDAGEAPRTLSERAYLDILHWFSETLGAIDAGSVFS